MDDGIFQSTWHRTTEPPHTGTRCIVTDGDVVVIATYISESVSSSIWLLSGIDESQVQKFKVQDWMPLPTPIKRSESKALPS